MIRYLLAFLVVFSTANAEPIEPTISVNGTGEATGAPDLARVHLGVETSERLARDALRLNSEAMGQILNVLSDEGVAPEDIQTSQLSLFPRFDRQMQGDQRRIRGYTAQNMLIVRVRELSNLGRILDQVSEAGSNTIHSISFGMSDSSALKEVARRAAIADARARAELYATEAGVSVGPVLTISEIGGRAQPQGMAMARAESMDMAVPIAEGEVSLSANVHMVFGIQ